MYSEINIFPITHVFLTFPTRCPVTVLVGSLSPGCCTAKFCIGLASWIMLERSLYWKCQKRKQGTNLTVYYVPGTVQAPSIHPHTVESPWVNIPSFQMRRKHTGWVTCLRAHNWWVEAGFESHYSSGNTRPTSYFCFSGSCYDLTSMKHQSLLSGQLKTRQQTRLQPRALSG